MGKNVMHWQWAGQIFFWQKFLAAWYLATYSIDYRVIIATWQELGKRGKYNFLLTKICSHVHVESICSNYLNSYAALHVNYCMLSYCSFCPPEGCIHPPFVDHTRPMSLSYTQNCLISHTCRFIAIPTSLMLVCPHLLAYPQLWCCTYI